MLWFSKLAERTMEDEDQYFEIALNNGTTIQCVVQPNEIMRDFAKRLKDTTGVTIDISRTEIGGKIYDDSTDVLTYFSAQINTEATVVGGECEDKTLGAVESSGAKSGHLVGLFCSVPGCGSNKLDYPDLTMFQLPTKKERCLEWLRAINREDLSGQTTEELSREVCVCANHFLASQFVDKNRLTLDEAAVPALFLSDNVKAELMDEQEEGEELDGDLEILATSEPGPHPGALCRLCALPIDRGRPIYLFRHEDDIAAIINSCLPIQVSESDVMPKQIHEVCYQRLQLQASFTKACLAAEKKLMKLVQNFSVSHIKNGRASNKHHQCPLCCVGDMEMDVPEGYQLLADDVSSGGDEDLDDAEAGALEESSHAMDLIYLPSDRNFSYECDLCEESFSSAISCQEHCKIHVRSEYFPCVVCGLVFKTQKLFESHFFYHKLDKPPQKRTPARAFLTCATCNLVTSTKKDFLLHVCPKPTLVKPKPNSDGHSCTLCGKIFTNAARAEAHQATHEEGADSGLIQCTLCSESFITSKLMFHHYEHEHEQVKHECDECQLRFIAADKLELHKKIHNSSVVQYQCSLCSEIFPSLPEITVHIQTHGSQTETKKPKLPCLKCGNLFLLRSQLETHLERAHDSIGRLPSLIQYQCKVCLERIKTSAEVLVHRTTHWKRANPKLPFVCEYCGEGHQSPNALARHRRYLHPDERPYICTLCDESTRTLYEARAHRKTHTGHLAAPEKPQPKIYRCDQCPTLFSDRNKFLIHKKQHKSQLVYTCDDCGKSFPDKTRFIAHQRFHTGEKPYACGTCGKRFSQTSALYTHAMFHTGEKPHTCDICGKKYRIKADRDSHRRTHTGEKPYKCQYCSKSFRTGQVYYQHRMIHTDDRRFRCDICGKGFKRSHTLVCHRRIHTGEKPNICLVCGKGFRQRTDMRKHMATIHNAHTSRSEKPPLPTQDEK